MTSSVLSQPRPAARVAPPPPPPKLEAAEGAAEGVVDLLQGGGCDGRGSGGVDGDGGGGGGEGGRHVGGEEHVVGLDGSADEQASQGYDGQAETAG